MINSVSMSSMSMMGTSGAQRQSPSSDKTVFDVADTNMDGIVSSSELDALTAGIEEITGNSLDVEAALSTYDADGDGGLSGEELFGLISSQGFNPSGMVGSEEGESGMMPPPPPPPKQVSSAYQANSDDDSISQLIELLNGSSESEEDYSALKLTA